MAWNVPSTEDKIVTKPIITTGKPGIHILFPHRGTWIAEFVEATWKPLSVAQLPWCEKHIAMCRVPSLPNARNVLVKTFLESTDEWCLWIDEDMIVETPVGKMGDIEIGDPNLALQIMHKSLVDSGESIVTGLYRAKQKHGFHYAIWNAVEKPGGGEAFQHIEHWQPPEANWFSVSVAGMGFMLMHRRVFEAMRDAGYGTNEKPYFHWEHPGARSEDFDMLMKAGELGFKTWCLTDVKLSHFGLLVLETGGNKGLQLRVPKV